MANNRSVNDRNDFRINNYLKELRELVVKNNLSKNVRFDIMDINDKHPLWWKYFAIADLIMLPYRGGIGSGIFAHAMASKKPVISSDIDFFKEISKKYNCINTVSESSNYPHVINESLKRKNYLRMVLGCKKYLKEYGFSVLGKKYVQIYNLSK